MPGEKRPAPARWSRVSLDPARIRGWIESYPDHGVGLRTGRLAALDIDELDPDRAHAAQMLAEQWFGATLVRVGQWPKRLLLYRVDQPFQKLKSGKIEVLGLGQQFVAFGLHKLTGRPYYWTTGETPLEVHLDDLPIIDREGAAAFLAEIGPGETSIATRQVSRDRRDPTANDRPLRDSQGLVVDGRDDWFGGIAFHSVHDAMDGEDRPSAELIAALVWKRFCETADLSRPKQDGVTGYVPSDALTKVQDKLRLARDGRLPGRDNDVPAPSFGKSTLCPAPGLALEEVARRSNRLKECITYARWHARRVFPDPVLVVTYKAIEEAFAGIANVETAHFNAVAGLDG